VSVEWQQFVYVIFNIELCLFQKSSILHNI